MFVCMEPEHIILKGIFIIFFPSFYLFLFHDTVCSFYKMKVKHATVFHFFVTMTNMIMFFKYMCMYVLCWTPGRIVFTMAMTNGDL